MLDNLYQEPTPVAQQHIRGGRLQTVQTAKATPQFAVPLATPQQIDPAVSWSFFHPSRVDVRFAPPAFRQELHALDPNLDVTWHPLHERWCVWVRNPRIRHKTCPGWQLLFPVRYGDGSYMPLDARTLAEIVHRSPRKWGNGRKYFDRIIGEINRDRQQKKTAHTDVVGAIARDKFDYAQIKNIGHGTKFATHHSGN